jgi:hypothetical protein
VATRRPAPRSGRLGETMAMYTARVRRGPGADGEPGREAVPCGPPQSHGTVRTSAAHDPVRAHHDRRVLDDELVADARVGGDDQ